MKTLCISILCILFLSAPQITSGQQAPGPVANPPVSAGGLFGNRGVSFQMLVNKKLQSVPRLGFFSVTSLVGEWERREISDLMTQGNITYQLVDRIDLSAGFHVTPQTGFKPSAGFIYSYADPEWLVVINPRADLIRGGSIEGMTLLEYKPRINENLRFYSRLQGLYGFSPRSGDHSRSYLNVRAGLTYLEFTFGAGANIDYYGPARRNENNVGVFLTVQLI